MGLSTEEIQREIKENKKGPVLTRAKAHQNRIKFHTETRVTPYIAQPLTDFLSNVSALIPDDKFRVFKILFRFSY